MIIGDTPLIRELYDGYIADSYDKNYAFKLHSKRVDEKAVHVIIKKLLTKRILTMETFTFSHVIPRKIHIPILYLKGIKSSCSSKSGVSAYP